MMPAFKCLTNSPSADRQPNRSAAALLLQLGNPLSHQVFRICRDFLRLPNTAKWSQQRIDCLEELSP